MKQYLALKASAGSGKTFALTVRYISLMLLDAKPTEILTLTFTNKAAAQMSNRIYETLISLGDDENILNAIIKEIPFSKDEILDKKDILIDTFITSELSIYTIDKFVNKILREFSGYIGVNDDFDIKFDDEELLIYKFLSSLDNQQFNVLINFAHNENKKLDSIIEIFKILIDKNIKYKQNNYDNNAFLSVQKAILDDAQEIKNFIDNNENVSKSAYKAVDFHNIDELLEKGITWLTKDSLSEFSYFKKAKPPAHLDIKLSKLQKNINLYYVIQESFTLQNLFQIFNDFKNFRTSYNKKRNALEFSDITNLVYNLLENNINKDFLYFRLDTKYNHILIDEFQDTATIQYKILYHLIEEIISGSPEIYKTFFYVGDVKQSIYRFRGGKKELFDYVAEIFKPNLEVDTLDINYRSSKNIVKFVNKTFLSLKDYDYTEQKINSKIEGFVEVTRVGYDEKDFFKEIYEKVKELLNKGIKPSNIAILTYTNKDVLNLYEYLKSKIPTLEIVTDMTSKLINQKNVKAVINGIKYLYFKEEIYKTNFNSLIGYDYFKEFEFSIDIKTFDIVTIVKKLSYFYNIVDENVIRLIESCGEFDTIVDFVYDIDKLEVNVVSSSLMGLQILTIFKAKGLEFDTVFVLDRVSKKNPDKSSLLFEYEDIELKNLFFKRSKREKLDEYYRDALDKEKNLSLYDELNIIYVALTRAENNMIIFKKEKNSVFENIINILELKEGELYIDSSISKHITKKEKVDYTPLSLGFQDKDKKEDEDEELLKARYFGIATHYCLEMMREFNKDSLDYSLIMVKNRYKNILLDSDFRDIENRINLLISNKEFQNMLKNSTYRKEQSLIFNNEHKIIDLLIKNGDSYMVIDYKTTLEKSYKHIKQVSNYVQGIKDITKSEDVKSCLIYLHKDNIDIVY